MIFSVTSIPGRYLPRCAASLLILLASMLFGIDAHAVILVDNVNTVVDNNPTSLTVTHTTGGGADRLMIVGVSFNNNDFETVTSVTYGGVALTFIDEVSRSDDSRVELWSYLDPPSITANVVVSFNEQVQSGAGVGVITFTGVNQAAPYGPFQSNNGNSTNATLVAISAAGETVLGVMAAEAQDNNPIVVGGNAQWTYKTQPGNNRTAGAGATYAGAPLVNLGWNLNEPDDWVVGAISLRDAATTVTTSPGFCDDFESGLGNWSVIPTSGGSAGINSDTANSGSSSLFTRWGGVNVTTTTPVDATGKPYRLSLWIRRGDDSFSEDPDGGENFEVQYFNSSSAWITLETFAGNGTPGEIFERNYALPADARHANLLIRLVQTGGSGSDFDYWHADDVCLLEVVQPEIEHRMDELSWSGTAGEVADSSGNGNNATARSGLGTINPGQICRAGDFDGIDDYIESSSIFALLRDTASMSFWIRTSQTGNDIGWRAPGIAGAEQAGGTDDIFWGWLDASGRIGISVGDNYASKSTSPINDDSYHHIVLTRDAVSGDYKIYVDGVLDVSGSLPAGVIGTAFSSLGRIEDTGGTPEYFEGDLDELLVFDSVLTDSAVTSIYQNQRIGRNLDGTARNCQGSLAYFRLDEDAGIWNGSAGEILDQSGNFTGAFALGTGAGVDAVPAQVCNGIDVPPNASNALQYGFDSGIDIDGDIGNRGSISFWYRSDTDWAGGGNRMLFDASPDDLPGADKYFFLALQNSGRLRFSLEDSSDGDFSFQTGVNAFPANTWVHVAVTWNMSGARQIFINGGLAASQGSGTNGQIGALRTLYFGDNRSSYHPGGFPNSANGIIDEVRVYDRVQSAAEITADLNATHLCPIGVLDNFLITPALLNASTCRPNAVTIVARDAANNVLTGYTGTASISTSTGNGNWSPNTASNVTSPNPDNDDNGSVDYSFLPADMGMIILDLRNTHAETLNITVQDVLEGVSDTVTNIVFSDNAFVITEDSVQVAGRPQAMTIEMVTTDPMDPTGCGVDPNYNYTHDLDVSIDRGGVLTGANPPRIGGVDISNGPPVAIQFAFTAGVASFDLDTDDVGQYRLTFTDNNNVHVPGAITGDSALLTVRPFGFAVDPIEAGPSPTANPQNPGDGGQVFTAAGSPFRATITAVLWESGDDTDNNGVLDSGSFNDNAATPSYDFQTALVALASGFTPPAPAGSLGALNNNIAMPGDFSGGVASFADADNLNYSEVGSFTLQAQADNYLGVPNLNIRGAPIVVGRFTPFEFRVTSIDDAGEFAEACTTFTYIGQDFTYENEPVVTVTAFNALGGITANYIDAGPGSDFMKLDSGSLTVVASRDEAQQGTDLVLLDVDYTHVATQAPVLDPLDPGRAQITFGFDNYRYGPAGPPADASKARNSQVAAFEPMISPRITQISDGEVSSTENETFTPAATPQSMRFGRLRMENVFGSELNDLRMPVFTEYWNGTAFIRNIEDTCTSIQFGDLVLSPAGFADPSVVEDPASAGVIDYLFPSPGAGNEGSVLTETLLDASGADRLWLRYDWDNDNDFDDDPEATATFGIFEGDPVQIYIQQTFEQ